MPWHVTKSEQCPADHPWAIIKDDTGEKVACHMTEEDAQRQVEALYANMPEAERAEMAAKSINDLPDSAFAYIEEGGKKDKQGKTVPRSKRHFPIHDAAHVRNALARAPQSPYGDKAMPKIRAAAKKMGVGEPTEAKRSEPELYVRSWMLEDVVIRSGGDGRTVEAYAAPFDSPAEIQDQHGHYMEEIDRTAFNRTLSHGIQRVSVFYHHGMTLHGTPSDLGSVPIGRPVDIKPDQRGLLTVTRYNKSQLADSVLEAIRNGDIPGYSFRGRIYKSKPDRVPRARSGGSLPTVRRMELGLTEYGPTPSPAYAGAGIIAMRSAKVLTALDEAQRFIQSLSPTSCGDPGDDSATSNQELGTEDPRAAHSARLGLLRLRSKMRDRGL